MATYVLLSHFTEEGMRNVAQSPSRVDALKQTFRTQQAEIKEYFLLTGHYDTLLIFDAPDDETCARLALSIGKAGNVRTEILRAFTADEFRKLAGNLP
jgi:uncharacterized protein with GYD domain